MGLPRTISSEELATAWTGHEVPRKPFQDSLNRKRQLREQSEAVVDKMERCSIPGRTGRDPVSIVGMVTGRADELPNFRNCNLIPTIHSRNMRGMHNDVDFYISKVRKKSRLRMLVISGGWVSPAEYRKHHKAHTRKMSRFAAHPKLKAWGIQLIFYNVENNIQRDDDGRAMLNLHSHALIHCHRHIGKKKWAEYLKFVRKFFPKGYAQDSAIQKAAEVVKYCFKLSEFELLTDTEFGDMARQIIGGREVVDPVTGEITKEGPLKFFIPLGPLRKLRRELKGRTLVKGLADDDRQWRVTEKKKKKKKQKQRQKQNQEPNPERGGRVNNIVLAVTRPLPVFTPRMEPCIIVQGYTGDFVEMVRQAGLGEAVSRAKALYADRVQRDEQTYGEPAYIKDTTTTDVRIDTGLNDYIAPPPDTPPPIFPFIDPGTSELIKNAMPCRETSGSKSRRVHGFKDFQC
jgi:hypothetical protein